VIQSRAELQLPCQKGDSYTVNHSAWPVSCNGRELPAVMAGRPSERRGAAYRAVAECYSNQCLSSSGCAIFNIVFNCKAWASYSLIELVRPKAQITNQLQSRLPKNE